MHKKVKEFTVFGRTVRVCVTTARKSCEHFMTIGAGADLFDYVLHIEWWSLILAGKLAFVVGAIGVYLMHYEEVLPSTE